MHMAVSNGNMIFKTSNQYGVVLPMHALFSIKGSSDAKGTRAPLVDVLDVSTVK